MQFRPVPHVVPQHASKWSWRVRASSGRRALVSRKGTLLNRPVTLERGPIWHMGSAVGAAASA